MQLITICDAEGNIVSIMTAQEGGLRPSFADLPPHQRQIEIDAPDISDELSDAEIHQRLRDLRAQYKVDPAGKKFIMR